jgi:Na+-driven multidrug efflux pump
VIILPVATASTIRIQTLLKAKEHGLACTSAWVNIIQGFFMSCFIGFVVLLLQYHLGYIFSSNMDVVHRTEKVAFYSSFFCIPYGFQMTLKGILRATNFQLDMIG